jgi:outer membrane receptor protein involved in Fe transport
LSVAAVAGVARARLLGGDGVAAFQLGNPDLVEESNVNAEVSLRYQGRRVRGSLSAYRNPFADYIYLADSRETLGSLPIFVHAQADATIRGVETSVDLAPVDWLKLSLAYTLTDTRNEWTGTALPQTPPDRVRTELRVETPSLGPLALPYVALAATFVGRGEVYGFDRLATARALGIHKSTLYRKLRALGLALPERVRRR